MEVLTISFQTELAIEAHVEVFDIRRNVAKTHNVVSTTQSIVANTHNIVSDIRHTLARHQGGYDDRNSSVGDRRFYSSQNKPSLLSRLRPGLEFQPQIGPVFNTCTQNSW